MAGKNGASPLQEFVTDEALPTIKINGTSYALRLNVEYVELLRLRDLANRIQEIADNPDRTEQEEDELSRKLRNMTATAIDAPEDVLGQLTDLQRFQISQVFNEQISERMGTPTEAGG